MGLFSRKPAEPPKQQPPQQPPKQNLALDDLAAPVDPMNALGAMPANPGRMPVNPGELAAPAVGGRRKIIPTREQRAAFEKSRTSSSSNAKTAIATILESTGVLNDEQIQNLLKDHGESAARIQRAVTQQGLVKEMDFLNAMAQELGMERVALGNVTITPELLARVDKRVAKEFKVFPVSWDPALNEMKIAIADPLNITAIDDLERLLQCRVVPMVASEEEIDRYFKKFYEADVIQKTYNEATEAAHVANQDADQYTTMDITEEKEDQPAVVKFVDLIFRQAVHDRASDIHIEPTRSNVTIRFRVDGVLHELPSPPKKWQNAIVSRLKVLSGMDLSEKRIPQDGRIKLSLPDRKLDLRVSVLPSIHGESIVMRILDQQNVMLGLEDVGFLPGNVMLFRRLISSPNGIIVMTGPTGSGKTTTLYSALGTLNNPETKIITIENPVEYMIDGINQVQVNEEVGLDFKSGLRALLRQSPDVLLVGEIRDLETAEIAIRAALTGHLVFSTLHTNDAPSATTRLIDMGIKPFLVASALQAVIAQRLIRKLCSQCKKPYTPTMEQLQDVGATVEEIARPDSLGLMSPVGCERCSGKGYRGRTAIHEIFVMDSKLRSHVIRGESATRLKKLAVKNGMLTLRADAWTKAKMGITSTEEVVRLTAGE